MTASTGNVPGRIFMSYRRDDTAYPAGWLYDRLASHFGRDQVFKDIDSIELGDDFAEAITTAVGSCDVLLAVIGRQWLTITGQDGRRRLEDPGDFVRIEIEAALARAVGVIPILVEGARMPHADELPPSLANLARRQALELSPNRFDGDTQRLLRVLDRTIAQAQEQARQEAERLAMHRRQVEQLQGQIRERAAVQDWDAVVAASQELAALDPAAADPDGLATAARGQITRRREAEEQARQEAERLAEYDAQIRKLQAEAEERASELEGLRKQASTAHQLTAEEERQLQIAIDTAERRLDDTREAEAAARAARVGSAVPSAINVAERAPLPGSHYQREHLRRSVRFRILVGLLAIICTAGVVAYISLPGSSASAGSSGPASGGTLHIVADAGPDHLDTVPAYYTEDYTLERAYTRQLVSYPAIPATATSGAAWNKDTTPAADVAEQVPTVENGGITNGGTVYTFHIKQGVEWNTAPSRQVTAYDFIREFKAFCNPVSPVGNPVYYENTITGLTSYCDAETAYFANSAANPPTASDIAKFQDSHNISGIQATNSLTLKFTLIQPVNDFLYLLALPFASARPVEYDSYVPDSQQLDQHTISDGPYQISSYRPDKSITLVRNPAWKQSTDPLRHDYVDSVVVTVGVDSPQAQLSYLEAGTDDLQMVGNTSLPEILSSIPALAGSQTLSLTIWPWPNLWPYLVFNLRSPDAGGAVKKLLVRQAIEYGLDKSAVLEAEGGPGLGTIVNSATLLGSVGYKAYNLYPDNDGTGNVSTCQTDLAKAGYPHGVTLTYMYPKDSTNTSVFTAVQSSLASCGITLIAKTVAVDSFFQELGDAPASDKPGAWDIGQPAWIPDWYGDNGRTTIQSLFQGPNCVLNTINYGCYDNATVNSLISTAEAASTMTEAAADWHAADMQIMKDAPIVPITSQDFPLYSSKKVRGVLPDGKSYPTAIFAPNIGGPDITNIWLANS